MPTYDYICGACDYEFEQFQLITAKPLRKCPDCGKARLKRLIGAGSGAIFKGTGFYQTDYRTESYKKALKNETDNKKKKQDKSDSESTKSSGKAATTKNAEKTTS